MKIGIVGNGLIARLCLEAMKEISCVCVAAMWTLPEARAAAKTMADTYGIPEIYTDYDRFLEDDSVEVVYIGIINLKHYEFARRALLSGKPVICEKPFTCNYTQAKMLADIAKERNLMLVEAVSFLYSPNFAYFKKQVGRLHGIRLVRCNYSQYSSRYDRYVKGEVLPVFSPEMAGGALYDINIYNINLAVALFGLPEEIEYRANLGFNGIDTSGIIVMQYHDFIVECCGAKDSASPGEAVVQAANGYVRLNGAPNIFPEVITAIDGEETYYNKNSHKSHMVYELLEFERIYRQHDLAAARGYLEQTLMVMEVAEKCRKCIHLNFLCDREAVV